MKKCVFCDKVSTEVKKFQVNKKLETGICKKCLEELKKELCE